MNKEEIKQILDELDWYIKQPNNQDINGEYEPPMELSQEEAKEIYDCITNLQEKSNNQKEELNRLYEQRDKFMKKYDYLKEENERLKEIIKENTILVKDDNGDYQECNINPLDYKSRNEKAIDKISKLKPFIPNEIPSWLDELENILNGGDEE